MDSRARFALRLRSLRKAAAFTQEELAARVGRSVDAISNLERGKSLPNFETIELLAASLSVPIKTLFDFDEHSELNRRGQLIEELQAVAVMLAESDLELAVDQVRAIQRSRKDT